MGTINQQGQPAGPAPIRGPIPTNVRAMMNPVGARSPVQLSPATIQQPVAARPSPKVARPAVVDLTRDSKPSTPGAKKNDFVPEGVQHIDAEWVGVLAVVLVVFESVQGLGRQVLVVQHRCDTGESRPSTEL